MYAPEVTARRVAEASERLKTQYGDDFELRYHNQDQVDSAISHFDDLMERHPKDNRPLRLRRPLHDDEQQFLTNERTLCALDFRGYWLPRYAWIINWRKQPQRFTPNVAQQIVLDLWADDERAGHAIWMQQLKARRLGVSTISELNVCHRYQFQPYANCVVASADPQKTIEMAGMIKYALEQQPWWLLPEVTKVKQGIPVEFGKQHATLAIEAGNQFTGVARGSAPNIVHLSELCEWRDADSLIDGALLPAILDDPSVFGILESTAKGPGWWKQKWDQVKRDWARGTGRIRPVFLPWFVGTDIYPTPADMRKRPLPATWIPEDRTIAHAERARDYVLSNPLLFKHLALSDPDWRMPRAQMWWREIGYQSAREEKKLHIFLAEYCADDFEAFQAQQNPLIDQEILITLQERTRAPMAVYTIVGPDIPPALVAPSRYFDGTKPSITINTRDLTPRFDAKYQLIPLVFPGYPDFDEQLRLLVWEMPKTLDAYGIGVDTSEGVGLDNAVIEVLREATPQRGPGQVAEWAANTVTAFQLWPLVLAVACLYSTPTTRSSDGVRRQCRLAIESWMNGSSTQHELQKRGWSNFHPWKYNDTKKTKLASEVTRVGVYTNQWFRSSMQDLWLTHLTEEAIDLPSPYLVHEITTLENVDGKAQAILGEHDDRWMGLGFPLYSLHADKPPHLQYVRQRVSYAPGVEADPAVPHPVWTVPDYAKAPAKAGRAPRTVPQPLRYNRRRGALDQYRNPNVPIRVREG